jgi:hypothetical protein
VCSSSAAAASTCCLWTFRRSVARWPSCCRSCACWRSTRCLSSPGSTAGSRPAGTWDRSTGRDTCELIPGLWSAS